MPPPAFLVEPGGLRGGWTLQTTGVDLVKMKREVGVEYFVKALSSGERTAAQRLEPFLAPDVTYETNTQPGVTPIGREAFKGRSPCSSRSSASGRRRLAIRDLDGPSR
jgi:hypothetical protein